LARDAPLPADTAHLPIGPGFLKLIAGLAKPQLPPNVLPVSAINRKNLKGDVMMSKATQVLGVVLLWFGVGLLGSSTATAQTSPAAAPSERTPAVISVPRLVKFSGAVQDSGGNPRSGITGITFAL